MQIKFYVNKISIFKKSIKLAAEIEGNFILKRNFTKFTERKIRISNEIHFFIHHRERE